MKVKQMIIGLITLLTLFGMVWAGNEYVAKQKDLQQLSNSFEAYRLEQAAMAIQKQIWYLEQQYQCPNCPQHIQQYNKLQYDLKCIREKLQRYYKG
ncbi:MAG: hypothetical protein ACYTEU_11900 [Planctomycetota bacterium]|jgi:hypothetical protein